MHDEDRKILRYLADRTVEMYRTNGALAAVSALSLTCVQAAANSAVTNFWYAGHIAMWCGTHDGDGVFQTIGRHLLRGIFHTALAITGLVVAVLALPLWAAYCGLTRAAFAVVTRRHSPTGKPAGDNPADAEPARPEASGPTHKTD